MASNTGQPILTRILIAAIVASQIPAAGIVGALLLRGSSSLNDLGAVLGFMGLFAPVCLTAGWLIAIPSIAVCLRIRRSPLVWGALLFGLCGQLLYSTAIGSF